MKKSVITIAVATTVGLGTIFGGVTVKTEAESISGLKGEQTKIQDQRSNLKADINSANDKINTLQSQQADVKSEKKRLDFAIDATTDKINDKTEKIKNTKAEVAKLQAEIKVIKERIQKRNVLLKERARSYQENGGMVSYLDVIMGSTSFNDFIDRANAVATIVQADQDILEQHEADKKELLEKQTRVETNLASLQKMLVDLKNMNQQLSAQKKEKEKLLASLKEQEEEAHEGMLDMQEREQILAAQEAAIKRSIQNERERQAREAAQAKSNPSKSGSSGSSSASSGSSVSSSAPKVSSGSFTRPAPGVITSGFGGRGGSFHYGFDIAKPGDNVPIVAAADGEVYVSHYSSSYGNVVYILHNINGQTYTTVYAHMRRSLVGAGATVKKGQQIGVMGNTGESRGQHLHFELYKGRWQYHAAINPSGIVPL
ncbi:peptidoglycan DD-metalloendopeptidase family protein [Priestia megaterium]|jgi:peptidoglycan hydrolase CwlO-like protein|uniref:Peptidoglycan DD-metalloendopeptidase family protein n=1 Tax=Priestia megaterium TaxID=1404 RepID=A0A6H1PB04_PRIMG|nr:peptidoglycan DD-metalloendopeptidase family protein [Priestia megaterium]QIZ10592.1 peptidoglycan DD-metalloendopeptidase family protein [Priestia megaterium]